MPSLNFLPHPAHYHLHSSSTTSPTTIVFLLRRKPNSRSNIRTHSQTLTPPMFSQFSTTSEGFSNASSLLFRIGTDAHLYDDPDDTTIPQLFDSRFDSEKVETLKRLLALIAQGADVVKNVASQSLEVKKLVYLYLLHYAEKRPNEALLSINCFQKDLSDTNPLLVGVMLSHNSPGVVGAPAVGFKFVCPNNLPLIGKSFRRLCETLPDVEEWGQIVLIEILLRYVVARHGFVRESIMCASQSDKDSMGVGHILDIFANGVDADAQTSCQNDDVKMLLRCTLPLLWSQNSSVVVAAAGVHWIMAPMEEVKRTVNPLLFVLRFSQASKYVEKKLKS